MSANTPIVTEMQVIPVAGYDSMEMTLSGAHAPYFTRNLVIIKDSSGGYTIQDFVKCGLPLVVLFGIVTTVLCAVIYL